METLTAEPQQIAHVDLRSRNIRGEDCLEFVFQGHFDKALCESVTQAWTQKFEQHPGTEYSLVWNCLEMDGFDIDAKNEWANTLSRFADRIKIIYVVSGSVLIRGAARLMGKFSKYDLQVVKSFDEL